jgi:hypothetical protein
MATYEDIPPPEPKEIDEKNWLVLKDLLERATLKGHPYQGTEQCDNCLYYLDPDADISYCWHPTLRILVGASGGASGGRPSPRTSAVRFGVKTCPSVATPF